MTIGDLTKDMSRYLADRIERCSSVEVRRNVEARELVGEERLNGLVVENLQTGERETIDAKEFVALLEGKSEEDVFGASDAEKDEEAAPESPPEAERSAGREGPRPVTRPRPGFAGGSAEMRADD